MNLEQHGYKMWKEDADKNGITQNYQKRMDTTKDFFDYPLCECNDKVCINIEYHDWTFRGGDGKEVKSEGYDMNLVHENGSGYWCDLKIYSLKTEDLEKNLSKFEKQLLEMWKVFYNADQNLS